MFLFKLTLRKLSAPHLIFFPSPGCVIEGEVLPRRISFRLLRKGTPLLIPPPTPLSSTYHLYVTRLCFNIAHGFFCKFEIFSVLVI